MTLPAPNLDDRRFQDLVDDAKRLVQRRCPEWTDHNVSDPGVTLIEAFAYLVEQLIYRLNRVPDRMYIKFLELIGVRLFPPTDAAADVTFWLSAPQDEAVEIPIGTEVATVRTESREAIPFTTRERLSIVPCSLRTVAVAPVQSQNEPRLQLASLESGEGFYCFQRVPLPGDTFLIGLSNAVPSCAVLIRIDCEIEGVGVDPLNPPLVWEAWVGDRWVSCELDRDETGGLNRAGDVVVHVPRRHAVSVVADQSAGWLRCRVVKAVENQPAYSASPRIKKIEASTIGGTCEAANSEVCEGEVLGLSEGVPGQRFFLKNTPVVDTPEASVLEVSSGEGWQEWLQVQNFADSDSTSRHFLFDEVLGEVVLGPAAREPDGTLRHYGAVPPKGAVLRLRSYRTGGGRRGNVARKTISVLKSTLPYVARVENRRPAGGGVDGEDLTSAKIRGPLLLRTRNRAVTVEDYELLAREAVPEVARVRCVPADGDDGGLGVRMLVVPAAAEDPLGQLRFEDLVPSDEVLERIASYLDERRLIGSRVSVEPPYYHGVTVVARLRARPSAKAERLQTAALEALYRYLHPISGGPEGQGWPFGRPVHTGEVYGVLQRLPGTDLVEDARLFAADPTTRERGPAVQRIEVGSHALVFSYEHQVRVEEP